MESISKQYVLKLARRAGIKTLSEDCYETLRNIMGIKLCEIAKHIEIVNSEKRVKTVSNDTVSQSLRLYGKQTTNTIET